MLKELLFEFFIISFNQIELISWFLIRNTIVIDPNK